MANLPRSMQTVPAHWKTSLGRRKPAVFELEKSAASWLTYPAAHWRQDLRDTSRWTTSPDLMISTILSVVESASGAHCAAFQRPDRNALSFGYNELRQPLSFIDNALKKSDCCCRIALPACTSQLPNPCRMKRDHNFTKQYLCTPKCALRLPYSGA